jgi:hypothetical protein
MDVYKRTQRIVEEWTPTEPSVTHLTLGTAVVARLLAEGLLRYDEPTRTHFFPMGNFGMGMAGFADVPVNVSETFPHLIFIEYSDGTTDTNGDASTASERREDGS